MKATGSGWKRSAAALLLGLAAAIGSAPGDSPSERGLERETFRQGWEAARRGDRPGMVRAMRDLDDYPLKPYLEFELLRQRIDQVPETVMEKFLARYRDWSFAPSLKTAWLRSLGRRDEFDALLRHGADSNDVKVRCHRARALIAHGRTDGLEDEIELLWLSARSRPDACEAAFEWWRSRRNPSPETAWKRFVLALDAGEIQLARYLRRFLDPRMDPWAERWLDLRMQPRGTLSAARRWQDSEMARRLVSDGVRRQARSDWESAAASWAAFESRFAWPADERARIEREIALFRAVALDAGALEAIDALPESARDRQMLEWRARAAMAHDEWSEVLASIQAMPVRAQASSRWRYWRGRALAAMGRPEAAVAFATLASEPDYYGFLAAKRLEQDLSLCSEELIVDAGIQRRLMRDAEFERAMELFHVGLFDHGRRTFNRVLDRLGRREIEQAALLAASNGWHDRAISALTRTGSRRAYPWRFPMAEKGAVLARAADHEVDPALIYGLMRAESAMQTDARSPAGAHGLLQLMPTTARAVARRNGLGFAGVRDLRNAGTNIALGIAHLAELEEAFDGDWVLVAAAYNAGANAVRRWLDERPVKRDPDVWIETLPYHETRDYVPRVLAFATIYEWQLERTPRVLGEYAIGG
ncbi:MAG: transglycosylase SLT domain-containing protein, partial [Wenzhouxiangella sp.]